MTIPPLFAPILVPLESFGANVILPVAALLVFLMGALMLAQAIVALIRGQTHVVPAPILIAHSISRHREKQRQNATFERRFKRELKQREYREWRSKQSKGW